MESLPNKLKTFVGDKGYMLSVGQKQRINKARTIYRNPQILIFDEETNSLGIKNENNIFENFPNLTCNNFFFMENKKIINLSYEDLLQNQKNLN